jgi:hypothetical protein
MNCAIGHGSSGGRDALSSGEWRIRTLASSVLQSQKLVSSSRSSSGVRRSDEKVIIDGSSSTAVGALLFRLAVFMVTPEEWNSQTFGCIRMLAKDLQYGFGRVKFVRL